MKILFIGDISAKPGRHAVAEILPELKKKKKIDFVVANCENAAHGKGITIDTMNELMSYGIDFFTAGEHVWDQRDFVEEMNNPNLPIVRPLNYDKTELLPGSGIKEFDLGKEGKLILITFLGQTFMKANASNPFWKFDEIWESNKDNWENATILVDFHAEATSEKVTFAHYLRDKVTAVLGTHTHVATADTRLFNGTGFVTDVGMVGPYDSSLWVKFENVLHNFKYPNRVNFEVEEEGRRVFNSVLLTISDEKTQFGVKKCEKIERIDKIIE